MPYKIKPCPFCGNIPAIKKDDGGLVIECGHHGWLENGMTAGNITMFTTGCTEEERAELVVAWNTRAAVTDEQFALAVHNGKAWQRVHTCHNIYDGREFQCSECGMQWHLLDREDFGEEWVHVRNPAYCPNCGAKVVK